MGNERKGNLFTQVPAKPPKRSLFDLSHEVKMSGKFGILYPVLCVDTLPGDSFRDTMNCMLRFAPMASPVMHRFDVTTHFFFVPYRIVWENWQEFITGGQDGLATPIPPYFTPAGLNTAFGGDETALRGAMGQGSLWDYLGLPVLPAGTLPAPFSTEKINVLPFYAACKIYNDYYRDPNLSTEYPIPIELDGDVSAEDTTGLILGMLSNPPMLNGELPTLRRGFEKDYFTSALPWAQRGAQVLMPMEILVDRAEYASGAPLTISGDIMHNTTNNLLTDADGAPPAGGGQIVLTGENATTTINDFRRALALQKWMEANARGGARYTEQIQGHFNVTVPDFRLQRAEYLGGGKQKVQISEVLATADNGEVGSANIGDMYGHGLSVGRTNQFTYRCQEHGVIIGFLSVTLRTAYSQGIPKMFSRTDKYEYAWPELAHLGEQEILTKELFYSFDSDNDDDNATLFGYIPRYAEYKFQNDRIAGDFRSSLSFWHEGRKFTQRPILDVNFTTLFENGDGGLGVASDYEESFRRIFNVNDGTDYLWMQLYHHLTVKRPLPYFGVPNII